MAIERRRPAPGLVHHSDRGVQYASRGYTKLLRENGIQISMSRRGNPYDNAKCESFMKTLKYAGGVMKPRPRIGDGWKRILQGTIARRDVRG